MCADPALGSEAMFKLGCGAIAPARDGSEGRAIAIRLPLGGAPVVTTAVIAGIILQSKEALAQRLPVLQQGVRQMVLEAAQLARQEQMLDVVKHQQLVGAGPEASSAAAVEHSEHGSAFTNEVIECLKLITTEPELEERSCLLRAEIRWGTAARQIATRSEGATSSHIDHVFITDTAATSVDEFAVDGDSGLGTGHGDERGLDHSILVVDLDIRSLLGVGIDALKAAPTKRRAAIKCSDKKRVERFREYATGEFTKRDMDGALTALIDDLALDTALRDRGRTERELDEGAPWEALRWQRRWDPAKDDGTLRWRISTALEVLGRRRRVDARGNSPAARDV